MNDDNDNSSKSDFNDCNDPPQPPPEPTSDPVSKMELDSRIEQRETPKPEYNLTPDGEEYSDLKDEQAKENEQRIKFIQSRLDDLGNTAKRSFDKAVKIDR